MTFEEFHKQIYAVVEAILILEESQPETTTIPVPKDWPALQAILRRVAESLILCADVDSAIAALKADRGALQAFLWLTIEAPEDAIACAESEAYAEMSIGATMLPGLCFSAYLLKLVDSLEVS